MWRVVLAEYFEARQLPHLIPPLLKPGLDRGVPGETEVMRRITRAIRWPAAWARLTEPPIRHAPFEAVAKYLLLPKPPEDAVYLDRDPEPSSDI